jgi:hypothetical protein
MNIKNLWKKYSLSFFQETTFSTRFPCQGSGIIKNQKIPSQKWKILYFHFWGTEEPFLKIEKALAFGEGQIWIEDMPSKYTRNILVLIILSCHLLMYLYFSWMQRIPIAIMSWSGSPCLCHHQDNNIAGNTLRLGLLNWNPMVEWSL